MKRHIIENSQSYKKQCYDKSIIEKLDIIIDKLRIIENKIIELESKKNDEHFKGICPYIG